MINAVLFDLDGTLLPMDNDIFTKYYFKLLCAELMPKGYDPQQLVDSIWAGTAAMVRNDNSQTNEEAFWKEFTKRLGSRASGDREAFENEAKEYGQKQSKTDLVVLAIAKAEGLEVTDKEIEDYYSKYAADYKATVQQVKNAIPQDELKRYLLEQEVSDFLYDNAVVSGK